MIICTFISLISSIDFLMIAIKVFYIIIIMHKLLGWFV